jgi:hypothetical protein
MSVYDNNYASFDAFKLGGVKMPELRYAYDSVLFSQTLKGLDNLTTPVKKHSEDQKLFLIIQKTNILSTDTSKQQNKNCHSK